MISILTPTRHRPKQLERMVNSLREVSRRIPEVVVYVDDDDILSKEKAESLNIKCVVGPRLMFTDYWNKCYEKSTGDILMMGADDLIFRTQDWDVVVEEAFDKYPDQIVLVYGDDLDIKMAIPSHPIIHRRWAETVGYFSPPYFSCGSCDFWLYEIAKFLGRKHFVRFIIEHKREMDDAYWERTISDAERTKVSIQYAEMFLERLSQAEKLQAVINQHDLCLTTN